MRYFIDYDHNDSSAATEDVAGDVEQHITREVRRMYREGVYGAGPFPATHTVAYAPTEGKRFSERDQLNWTDVVVRLEE